MNRQKFTEESVGLLDRGGSRGRPASRFGGFQRWRAFAREGSDGGGLAPGIEPITARNESGSSAFPEEEMSAPGPAAAPSILIAEDDALVRGSLAAVLELEGFEVFEACNGREAISRALTHKPDLVLLDLNMPQWDGWTAFSQLERVTPLLPVIVITARPNQYSKAVQLGVDAFMEKPLNIPVLVGAIKRLTAEDKCGRERRIIRRAFVTQLLSGSGTS